MFFVTLLLSYHLRFSDLFPESKKFLALTRLNILGVHSTSDTGIMLCNHHKAIIHMPTIGIHFKNITNQRIHCLSLFFFLLQPVRHALMVLESIVNCKFHVLHQILHIAWICFFLANILVAFYIHFHNNILVLLVYLVVASTFKPQIAGSIPTAGKPRVVDHDWFCWCTWLLSRPLSRRESLTLQ